MVGERDNPPEAASSSSGPLCALRTGASPLRSPRGVRCTPLRRSDRRKVRRGSVALGARPSVPGRAPVVHLDYSCGSCGRLVFEERAQTAASAATAGVRMLGDDSAFRGLYENPAGPLERYLERLAAATSRKGLEGDVAPYARPHTAAPGDGGLGVCEGRGRGVEEDGLAVRGEGDLARAFQDDVEEAACEPAGAFDALYVPVDA